MTTQRIELDLTPTQIEQLREVMDALPLFPRNGRAGYHELILAVLPKLPFESTAAIDPPGSGDASGAAREPRFSLSARTAKGAEMLPLLNALLCRQAG